jgi:prolyl-tRNA synthetase
VVALVLRGDHELNAVKAQKLAGVANPLRMASAAAVQGGDRQRARASIGPVGLKCPIYADHAALAMADFVCGANAPDLHLRGVNWGATCPSRVAADLRNVVDGDPSPSGKGRCASCAASRSATSSSSGASTASRDERHGAGRIRPGSRC